MTEHIERTFDADLEATGDGRTIIGRCVPYDVEALVADPDRPPYREIWRAGAFRYVLKAPHLVGLNFEHSRDLGGQIGRAVELEERGDGLWGTFRALPTVFGEQGLELVRSGGVRGLSVSCYMHDRGSRAGVGVVERVRVSKLEHVALTDHPAYLDAAVTAVRSDGRAPAGTPALDEVLDWQARASTRFVRS